MLLIKMMAVVGISASYNINKMNKQQADHLQRPNCLSL